MNKTLVISKPIERFNRTVWSAKIVVALISKPKVSDESQFHQPPHVPSCKAHQLPIHKATKFRIHENQLIDSKTLTEADTLKKNKFTSEEIIIITRHRAAEVKLE